MAISHLRTEEFDPSRISASRLNQYLTCGKAFKYEYVDLIAQERSGSAALFGSVIHLALERWALDRKQELPALLAVAWHEYTAETPVQGFLEGYANLSLRAREIEKEILERRPEIKAVRMTRDWKKHPISAEINDLVYKWVPKMADSPWRFTERDPLPALYDESFRVLEGYAEANRNRSDALLTEVHFEVPFYEFVLGGYIDSIEEGSFDGKQCYLISDYKTYRREPPALKDYRQLVFYYIAFHSQAEVWGLDRTRPVLVGADYVVLGYNDYKLFSFADVNKIRSEVVQYHTAVSNGIFLPASKNQSPDFCNYPDRCCMNVTDTGCASVSVEFKESVA